MNETNEDERSVRRGACNCRACVPAPRQEAVCTACLGPLSRDQHADCAMFLPRQEDAGGESVWDTRTALYRFLDQYQPDGGAKSTFMRLMAHYDLSIRAKALAERDRLRDEVTRLRAAVGKWAREYGGWDEYDTVWTCGICEEAGRHAEGCPVAAALSSDEGWRQ